MLAIDPNFRPSATQALHHKWLRKYKPNYIEFNQTQKNNRLTHKVTVRKVLERFISQRNEQQEEGAEVSVVN
jgi:lysyl-tRNA synthetase class I